MAQYTFWRSRILGEKFHNNATNPSVKGLNLQKGLGLGEKTVNIGDNVPWGWPPPSKRENIATGTTDPPDSLTWVISPHLLSGKMRVIATKPGLHFQHLQSGTWVFLSNMQTNMNIWLFNMYFSVCIIHFQVIWGPGNWKIWAKKGNNLSFFTVFFLAGASL